MFVVGLTGSIAMGKSTAARFFAEEGVPVHDADAAVHRVYSGKTAEAAAAVAVIEREFPGTTSAGRVDRKKLGERVIGDAAAIKRLEAIIHPLVRLSERRFLAEAHSAGAEIVVLDIPLLYETGADKRVDAVVVVSAPPDVQRARVLERPGMTVEKLDAILAQQMPDAEKRARADFVVDSSGSFDSARDQVRAILAAVRNMARRRG